MTDTEISAAHALVEFWRTAGPKQWFGSSRAFDEAIAGRFGSLHREACEGKLDNWIDTPTSSLALVLMLDQFSRNLYRGSAFALANDSALVVHDVSPSDLMVPGYTATEIQTLSRLRR